MRIIAILLLMLYSSFSLAGSVIRYNVSGLANVASGQHVFYVEGSKIKQEVSKHLYYLYDSSTDSLQLVDTNKRAYYPMSRKFFNNVLNTVSTQEQKLKDLLAQPSKLNKKTMAVLKQALDSMKMLRESADVLQKNNNIKAKLNGPISAAKYNGVECSRYKVITNKSQATVCYASFEELGLSLETVKTFNRFHRYLAKINGFNSMFALLDNSMPTRIDITSPINGTVSLGRVTSIATNPDSFKVPNGYQRLSVDTINEHSKK